MSTGRAVQFQEIFVQPGVLLLDANASYKSMFGLPGVLSFCNYREGNVHFFRWRVDDRYDAMDAGSQDSRSPVNTSTNKTSRATPSGSTKSTKPSLKVLFRDLKAIEFKRDKLCFFTNNSTMHSLYQFTEGIPETLIGSLEREQFIHRSIDRYNYYYCLDYADGDQQNTTSLSMLRRRLTPRTIDIHQMLAIQAGASTSRPTEAKSRKRSAPTDTECNMLEPRPAVHRGYPLDAKKWAEFRASDGSITDPKRVKAIVFRGGITDEIRADVWKYLLGFDLWEHTTTQREERRMIKTEEYSRMKQQWQTFNPGQERNFSGFRECKHEIEEDVKRTDKTHEFLAGNDNANLARMQDILMTYLMYNFNLGYIGGMSDLLAPILCLVQDEVESFWCFAGFMRKISDNFAIDQTDMNQLRDDLRSVLAFVNEKLTRHLKDENSENMYFCFQWFNYWLKKEFSHLDILYLWEVLWTELPCSNFFLFVCAAILDQQTDTFVDGRFTFAQMADHVAKLSGNLNVSALLKQAEGIYLQVKNALESSEGEHPELRRIIGMS